MMKKDLREKYLGIRKSILDKDKKSMVIIDKLLPILDKYQTIGVYAAMEDEVNLDKLIEMLLKQGKEVYLPRIESSDLEFYQIKSLNDLNCNGAFQIREPEAQNPLKSVHIAIIVPGISFDTKKHRLGFGRAYFDRYLKGKDVFKIGVCFDELLVDTLPVDDWDIQMDIVVSDKRICL